MTREDSQGERERERKWGESSGSEGSAGPARRGAFTRRGGTEMRNNGL